MESSSNTTGQDTNNRPPADCGTGSGGWGEVVTTLADEEIVAEVTTRKIGMTITTRRVRSLVASRR